MFLYIFKRAFKCQWGIDLQIKLPIPECRCSRIRKMDKCNFWLPCVVRAPYSCSCSEIYFLIPRGKLTVNFWQEKVKRQISLTFLASLPHATISFWCKCCELLILICIQIFLKPVLTQLKWIAQHEWKRKRADFNVAD